MRGGGGGRLSSADEALEAFDIPLKGVRKLLLTDLREWDSNGTNLGFNPTLGHTAGEFGHNDFYAVPVAAAQLSGQDGAAALRGMILHDEIRGRLAGVFSLKTYKIDHVVHGAIASAFERAPVTGAAPASRLAHEAPRTDLCPRHPAPQRRLAKP